MVFEETVCPAGIIQPLGTSEEAAAPLEAFVTRQVGHLLILTRRKDEGLDFRDLITAPCGRADPSNNLMGWDSLLPQPLSVCLSDNKSGFSQTWCIAFGTPQGSK